MTLSPRAAVAAAALCLYAAPAFAQEAAPSAEDRLRRLEDRLNALDVHYQDELRKRDAEIADLRTQLRDARQDPVAATQTAAARTAAVHQITQDILTDIETRKKDEPLARIAAVANPDIAVIADFLGVASTKNVDATRNRFDVREVELDIRAAVDPRADAVLTLAFARDAFPQLFGPADAGEIDTSADVEEAYLFLHDFGVPNLTARVGRYHVRFGRQNLLHAHDLPTVDAPFVLQSFLAPEALVDAGLEVSYLIPNPWNEYLELILELNSGEGAASESPNLRGDARAQSPSLVSHFLWNKNLTDTLNLELGASTLWGPSENDSPDRAGGRRDVGLYGADMTLLHRDPSGGFFNQFVQAEAIYGHTRQEDGTMANAFGAYLVGQQQLSKDWYAGVRLDWTEDANNADRKIWGVSPYLTWYWSEFLRFRGSYEHRGGAGGNAVANEDLFFLQITWIYGAHPPHPYWAMK
jgi:hypothetical protein